MGAARVVPVALVVAVAVAAAAARGGSAVAVGALWMVREDGSARRALTVLPAGTVLDRAGDRVAVLTDDGLVIASVDGTRVLVPGARDPGAAEFSPSGNAIAYTAWANGGYGLYVAASDGTSSRLVDATAGPAVWSRDGTSLVFATPVQSARADLVTERTDGSGRRVLVRRGVALAGFKPAVSPDGRSIAYECINSGGGGFCILRGRTVRRYPHGGLDALWSPTGRSVATTIAGDLNSGLDVVDLATGARRIVAPVPDLRFVDVRALAWSPDGRRLLYQRTCNEGLRPPACVTAVYVRTVATGKQKRISVDGMRWILARWRGDTITYLTQP